MIMEDTGLEVVSMKDAGIKADIEETVRPTKRMH